MDLNEVIEILTREDITKLYTTVYTDVSKCELLDDYCGIHHKDGDMIYMMMGGMMHASLLDLYNESGIMDCKDVTAFCIDILKDAELLIFIGHDLSIKHLDNSPDAIFRGVSYIDDNPNDEPEHPILSSIIILAENEPTVTSETYTHIMCHELVHFMFEYMQKILGYDELISDIKEDNVLEELLCDMLPFFYLNVERNIKSMIDNYSEYESKYIKTNVLENRLKYIKELQSL